MAWQNIGQWGIILDGKSKGNTTEGPFHCAPNSRLKLNLRSSGDLARMNKVEFWVAKPGEKFNQGNLVETIINPRGSTIHCDALYGQLNENLDVYVHFEWDGTLPNGHGTVDQSQDYYERNETPKCGPTQIGINKYVRNLSNTRTIKLLITRTLKTEEPDKESAEWFTLRPNLNLRMGCNRPAIGAEYKFDILEVDLA
jgi:hypothetical protein